MESPKPQKEHQWLQRLVGEWEFEHECQMGPDQPPMKTVGTQSTRSLGGFWIIGEITGSIPDGSTATSIITIGYDPARKQFVGSFVSTCMTHFWPYSGSLDAAEKKLTLDSEGPSCSGDGSMAKYQDIIEFIDDNHHTMSSQYLGPDGQWVHFMGGHYRRTSSK